MKNAQVDGTRLLAALGDKLAGVRGRLTPDFDMSKITWFRTGGPAELMFQPEDDDDLSTFLAALPAEIPVMPVGIGSNLLVRDGGKLEACRAVFGDDSIDYGQALQRHYAEGAPPDWQQNYVSAYATTHPWEDFAETWAHYLHIVDTLEMGSEFGIQVRPRVDRDGEWTARIRFNPYEAVDIETIVNAWLPFAFAMNSVSNSS